MKPTRPSVLIAVLLATGVGGWVLLTFAYDNFPLKTGWAVTIAIVAVLIAFLAWTTRNRLRGEHGTRPPDPLTVARYAALAKACSPVGAGVAGVWLGFFVYLVTQHVTQQVRHDRFLSIGGAVSGLGLAAAALWLEWVCRIKVSHDDDKPPRGGAPAGA